MNAHHYQEPRNLSISAPSPIAVSGFQAFESQTVINSLKVSACKMAELQSYWNNLATDSFMADGGNYRLRRFGVFSFHPSQELMYVGNRSFYQDPYINTLNGGSQRQFAPLEESFQQNSLLRNLILHDIDLLPIEVKSTPLSIYIHQVRILANKSGSGKPTPEGIHQDGHLFVAQHLIKRESVSGGESTIYCLDKRAIFHKTLSSPLDTLLVNDPMVFHSVSSIEATDETGYRDMLLIDFNLLSEV